jgi:hypothetical protein
MDALARLVAIEEIRQLKSRYFRFVDTRDFEGFGQLFCRDAVWDATEARRYRTADGAWVGPVGEVYRGRETIATWVRDAFRSAKSGHFGHSHEITIESDTEARGIVGMEDHIRAADGRTRLLYAAGHYHERYRVEDGAWRIAETRLTRLFCDEEPGLLATMGHGEA